MPANLAYSNDPAEKQSILDMATPLNAMSALRRLRIRVKVAGHILPFSLVDIAYRIQNALPTLEQQAFAASFIDSIPIGKPFDDLYRLQHRFFAELMLLEKTPSLAMHLLEKFELGLPKESAIVKLTQDIGAYHGALAVGTLTAPGEIEMLGFMAAAVSNYLFDKNLKSSEADLVAALAIGWRDNTNKSGNAIDFLLETVPAITPRFLADKLLRMLGRL